MPNVDGPSSESRMAMVEIRLAPADVPARLDDMRRWLDAHATTPAKFASTGSSNETVVLVEFSASTDAEAFAAAFSGTLIAG